MLIHKLNKNSSMFYVKEYKHFLNFGILFEMVKCKKNKINKNKKIEIQDCKGRYASNLFNERMLWLGLLCYEFNWNYWVWFYDWFYSLSSSKTRKGEVEKVYNIDELRLWIYQLNIFGLERT